MAFHSRNIEDYIKICRNPELGLQYNKTKTLELKHTPQSKQHLEVDIKKINEDEYIEFQILDLDSYNIEDEDEEESVKYFNIMMFGKTRENKSVYVNIENFTPYFYVEIDSRWRSFIIQKIIKDIQKTIYNQQVKNGLISFKIIKAHKFHGFTNDAEFNFLHVIFRDYDSMKAYARAFQNKHIMSYISRHRKVSFKLYESNIHPILRFLHIKNIDPVGWCRIYKKDFKQFKYNHNKGTTDININCNWKSLERLECSDIHKFIILSFDIECNSCDGNFPQAYRDDDKVIQIGMTYSYLGDTECFKKVVLCLGDTSDIKGCDVICYETEKELLLGFTQRIRIDDPDIITGYNIFGFDFDYLKERAKKFKIYQKFSILSRIKNKVCKYIEQTLSSSAMGQNNLKYYHTPGRVCIDLMKVIQRDYKLNGYKLDNVSSTFIRDNITGFSQYGNKTKLTVKSSTGIKKGDYIAIYYNEGLTDNKIGKKYKVYDTGKDDGNNYIIVNDTVDLTEQFSQNKCSVFWCQAKDDVSPKDIFRLYKGDADAKSIVAKYCLKDCSLCNRLMAKLQILPNSIGMGNVCCVPLSYLFLRGQSIKIFSLVAKQCREENYLIPTVKKKWKPVEDEKKTEDQKLETKSDKKFQSFIRNLINNDDDSDDDEEEQGYEGATVFVPDKGVHYDPIIVDDYGSLYPSSMIMKNLSHNSILLDDQYDNLPDYIYHSQSYNNTDGTTTTYKFAERKDGKKATIPRILMKLLSERSKCKKLVKIEKDPFKKSVWDGLQLAYKITANSLYGQCGSPVSPIAMRSIAACTTAIGRDMLILAKDYVENEMNDIINLIKESTESGNYDKYKEYMRNYYKNVSDDIVKNEEKGILLYDGKEEYYDWVCREIYSLIGPYNINPKCIYGDTDSVFFKLNMTDRKTGEQFRDQKALEVSIKMGILTSGIVNYTLDRPQVLEYEKVYWPFVIISKKRYVGNLYEFNPKKFKQKSMGLVTKRRDNADIVKDVVGGIIEQILDYRSPIGAVNFTKDQLMKIITGKYNIEKFTITKTLKDKEAYKDWSRIAHAVLANRMGIRDAGNKPQSNDRLPFVYVENRICIIENCNNVPIYSNKCEIEAHYCDKHKDEKMERIINKKKLQGERIEYPSYLLENKLKIDFLFYITNQIMKPALQFLELIVHNPENIFNMYIIREENRKAKIQPIMKYYNNCETNKGNNLSVGLGGLFGDDLFGKSPPKLNKRRIQRIKKTKKIV